jgi:ubiquinone/menaquinone biosynthesis C-methylase UbiE
MAQWFEDESIWRDSYDISFNSAVLNAADQEVEKILRLADFKGGDILDLACGPGRHAIPLSAKGHKVTGVDLTKWLLEKAETAAEKAGVQVEWIQEDMRRYVRPNTYSLAICMYNSLGYFQDREDDFVTVANVFESLKAGGAFVLECAGKEPLARTFQSFTGHQTPEGVQVFMTRKLLDDWSRTENTSVVVRGDRVQRFRYVLNLYSGRELKELLGRAGFKTSVYGNLDGAPYDQNASNLFAVARKP